MFDFLKVCIRPETSVLQALRIIDSTGAQIALVVDSDNKLIGTMTDGDVRRGLLNGQSLDSPVKMLMNKNFRFFGKDADRRLVLEMMRREKIHQIPVLNENGTATELLLLEELLSPPDCPNAVVIMAGGKGTRLRPFTENCPKPMLLVGEKPMLQILLEQCIESGFKKFYFSVNYLKDQIIDYFQDGSEWGVSIEYLVEDMPLGTAGSLSLLPERLDHPFVVMNGDVLTKLNLNQLLNFHHENNAIATLCVREHEVAIPFGVVQAQGSRLVAFEEKPTYRHLVNAGVYAIDYSAVSHLNKSTYVDMPYFLENIKQHGQNISVFPIHEYWLDIGRPETLKQAHQEWSLGDSM